jgi:hypothetical protein
VQLAPQAPQASALSMLVSHPSDGSPLQSSNPASHTSISQAPPTHAVDPTCGPRGHKIAGSPSSIVPSQFWSTPSQVSTPSPLMSASVSSQSTPKQPTPPP